MNELFLLFMDKIVTRLPGLLLRVFYRPANIANEVQIDLRGERPIDLLMGTSVPRILVYLQVTNHSNFKLELDRMLIDLWFGQPVLNGAILQRHCILPRTTNNDLFFASDLTSQQVQQIEPYTKDSPSAGPITVSIHAYFESKLGLIEVKKQIRRTKV